jgi:hypothetical protein
MNIVLSIFDLTRNIELWWRVLGFCGISKDKWGEKERTSRTLCNEKKEVDCGGYERREEAKDTMGWRVS